MQSIQWFSSWKWGCLRTAFWGYTQRRRVVSSEFTGLCALSREALYEKKGGTGQRGRSWPTRLKTPKQSREKQNKTTLKAISGIWFWWQGKNAVCIIKSTDQNNFLKKSGHSLGDKQALPVSIPYRWPLSHSLKQRQILTIYLFCQLSSTVKWHCVILLPGTTPNNRFIDHMDIIMLWSFLFSKYFVHFSKELPAFFLVIYRNSLHFEG